MDKAIEEALAPFEVFTATDGYPSLRARQVSDILESLTEAGYVIVKNPGSLEHGDVLD